MLAIKNTVIKLSVLILFFYGCKTQKEKVTKAEALEFAMQVEKTIAKGDNVFLDNAISKEDFLKRVDLEKTNDAINFIKGALEKFRIGSQVTTILADKDDFDLVKYYEKNGSAHLIFRVYMQAGKSLNYHDYEIVKREGKIKIADVYIYLSGELLSETCKNLYITLLEEAKNNKSGFSEAAMPELNDLPEIKKLFMSRKYKEAKDKLDNLPAYLRTSKTIQLMNIQVCAGIDFESFSKAIEEYKVAYPTAENINFIMIDGYFVQKDYEKALIAINKLDSQINKDPFLDYFRYLACYSLNKKAEGKKYLYRLTNSMPEFEDGFIELFGVYAEAGEKKQADSVKAIYMTKRNFNQERLKNLELLYK